MCHNVIMKRFRLWLTIGVSFLAAALALSLLAWPLHQFQLHHRNQADRPGVSFSIKYAQELGLDWKQTYLALLNNLGVRRFRLMSYWDQLEPSSGQYDFSDLDFQMSQAAQFNARVSLAIGLRQPRWPECHEPAWASELSQQEQNRQLDNFIRAVVEHYHSAPALESYQLENEALNTVFGTCKNFDRNRLITEFNLVKRLDPDHPIILNVSNEYGLPLGQPRGDRVGFSIYRRIYDNTITNRYVTYPFPSLWFRLKAALIESWFHRPVIIHELQAEPWGPVPTVQMSLKDQNRSMDARRLLRSVGYAKQTGIKEYYLWGGEWWYWRLTKFNDPSLWSAARTVFQD